MEALTACAIAALTVYDMCKSIDRSMVIGELALWEKTGGRSGTWRRTDLNAGMLNNEAGREPGRPFEQAPSAIPDGAGPVVVE